MKIQFNRFLRRLKQGSYTTNVSKNGSFSALHNSFNPGIILAGIVGSFGLQEVKADNTWDGGGGVAAWSNVNNWGLNTAPTLPGLLTFAGTTQLISTNDLTNLTINGFTFSSGAGAFVIGGSAISLGGGILNSSTNLQTINLNMVTTAARTVTMTSGGGNVTLGGDISGTGGQIVTAGTGVLTLAGNNSFTGATVSTTDGVSYTAGVNLASGATLVLGSNTAAGSGGIIYVSAAGSTIQAVSGGATISNGIQVANNSFTIGGSNALTINGNVGINGTNTITVNNSALTTFGGQLQLRNRLTSAGTTTINGTGNLKVTGAVVNNSGGTGTGGSPLTAVGSLSYTGTGTLTLAGQNTYTGATSVTGSGYGSSQGTVVLDGSSGGYLSGTAVTVANATNNATLKIKGNYTIGQSGAATLTVTGGNGTSTGQGTLSLVDGAANTLTINSTAAAGSTVLTLGNNSILNMEVGATSDQIALGTRKAAVTNTVLVNISSLGGLSGTTQDLISGSAATYTTGAGQNFVLNSTSGNFGGYTVALSGATSGKLQLTETATWVNPTMATAYWTGDTNGTGNNTWNNFTDGNANNTNWATNSGGTTDAHYNPGSSTDVYFSTTGMGSNNNTLLGAATTVNSLTFTSAADTSHQVTVGGSNALTLNAGAGAYAAGRGITVDSGSGSHTISAPVVLGTDQSWHINNATTAPLTVSGVISGSSRSLTKEGTGTLVVSGVNTYSGATTVNAGRLLIGTGGSLDASSAVGIANSGYFGGTGTANGAVTVNSGGLIGGGDIGTVGTLTLTNGLTIGTGGIAYFDFGDLISISSGGLDVTAGGAIIRVGSGLSSGNYNLITGTGLGALSGFTGIQYYDGNAAASNYTLQLSGGILQLSVATLSNANPTVSLDNKRVMVGTAFTVTGQVGNGAGGATLNGTLSDGSGTLAVGSLSPSPVTVNAGVTGVAITGSANSGGSLGNQTVRVTLNDPAASPSSATGEATVSVLQNREVTGSSVNLGTAHVGATMSGSTTLSSAGARSSNTDVTIANASADSNGIAVTNGSGNPASVFDGTHTSDTRTVGGTMTGLGNISGTISLTATGEAGVTGAQTPVSVSVSYTAQTFSGKARWTNTAATSWSTGANWTDTLGAGIAGAPGVDGAVVSIGDTASFGDLSGQSTYSVYLNGAAPTLQGLVFDSATTTAYTIATGTSGTINLQSGNSVNVATSLSPTISATMTGSNGLDKTGTGMLILTGANAYNGTTAISNGTMQITGGNDRLPITSALILGSGSNSGKLVLGDATNARNQTVAGLASSGTGTTNAVVGAAAANSVLTVNLTSGSNTYAGTLGGSGNENNLSLTKSGGGTLILSGNNTYTGGTNLSGGSLNVGSANALGSTGTITFSGGSLQYSAANTTDYSSRFATTGNSAYNIDTNGQNVVFTTGLAASGTSGLTKGGTGMLTLAAGNTYTGNTVINAGVLATPDASTHSLRISGGVWQPTLSGDLGISSTLGTSTGAGAVNQWTAGGFAAIGAKITVNLNSGAALSWGAGNFMGTGSTPMVFGSSAANNQVELKNAFNLNTTDAFNRLIYVEKGAGGDSALLSGVISQGAAVGSNNGVTKVGLGTLILSGTNTYGGPTAVTQGTLIAGADSLNGANGAFGSGTGTTAAPTASSAIIMGNGPTAAGGNVGNDGSPALLIGGAFTIGRNVTVNDDGTNNVYVIGGSTDNNATFSGVITLSNGTASNNTFKVTQVATTGSNALNITGGITGGATTATKQVNFNNVGAVNVSTAAISDGAGGGKIAVNQSGGGTTTFSAASTYTGGTTVSAGTLLVKNTTGSGTGFGAVSVSSGATLGGTGTIAPTGANGFSVSGVIAPGASIGNLTFDLSNTTGTVGMATNAGFQFELDAVSNPTIDSILAGSSDLLTIAGAAANDFSFNSNQVNFLNTGAVGFYKLFNTSSDNANTWTGLTFDGTSGLVSAGLTYSGLTSGLSGNFLVGTATNGGTTGDIYFQVIPEPRAALLGGLGMLALLRRRRR